MNLGLSEEQTQLVSSFASLLAKRSSTELVRAAEPEGFDPLLWGSLVDLGAVAMAVPEADGGWGATVVDLALVAEQVGRALAPAPVIESQVAARLLSSVGGAAATGSLGAVLAGQHLVTLAVRPATPSQATLPPSGNEANESGALVGSTRAALVPAGAVADGVIVLAGDRLLLVPLDDGIRQPVNDPTSVGAGRPSVRRRVENLGAAPLADVVIGDDAVELASGDEAAGLHEAAIDEWLALTAAALVGIGAVAQELTCAYARERHAWGAPIGTFQAVAHPLADSATALDGARLMARKAAWAADHGHARARELAAMAFAFAAESARDATYRAVHFHGGYGFMLEQDVQLYFRRARAWARVWGDPATAYRRAARARYLTAERD